MEKEVALIAKGPHPASPQHLNPEHRPIHALKTAARGAQPRVGPFSYHLREIQVLMEDDSHE